MRSRCGPSQLPASWMHHARSLVSPAVGCTWVCVVEPRGSALALASASILLMKSSYPTPQMVAPLAARRGDRSPLIICNSMHPMPGFALAGFPSHLTLYRQSSCTLYIYSQLSSSLTSFQPFPEADHLLVPNRSMLWVLQRCIFIILDPPLWRPVSP